MTQVRLYSGGEGDRSQAQYVVVDEVNEKVSQTRLRPQRPWIAEPRCRCWNARS